TLINSKACEVLGWAQETAIGRDWFKDSLREDVRSHTRAVFRRLMLEEVSLAAYNENSVVGVGGRDRLIGWHNIVLRGPGGEVRGTLSSGLDITDQRVAEDAIRVSERNLRTIFEDSSDGIVLVDPATRMIQTVNRTFGTITGYSREESATLRIFEVFPDLAKGVGVQAELAVKRADGSTTHADVSSSTIVLEGQDLLMCTFHDVSEQRRVRSRLAQSDRLATMGMLAAGVAHEINNPLSYVVYNLASLTDDLPLVVEAMREGRSALEKHLGPGVLQEVLGEWSRALDAEFVEEMQERFDDAREGSERIREIVRALGTFSRVEKEELQTIDMVRVLDGASAMALNEIKYRAKLVKSYENLPPVLASEGRLSQVFLNLLINAAHAIDEGHADGNEIRIQSRTTASHIHVEIIDTGCGIAAEHLPRLFEPFFTTKELGEGSGLGLAISRSIVEGFGGEIEVESRVGEGSCFRVSLPRLDDSALAETDSSVHKVVAPLRGARILFIDDEPAILNALSRIFRAHEIHLAHSGEEAQKILAEALPFDVILCDLMMPRISGIELHEWIVNRDPELAERVIFMSGGVFTSRARSYLQNVANPRVDKPFEVHELKKVVNRVLRR
ncbi:MAG: PAS domain S-box protein, partial [Deltaproteobacteria bacterium]|nr:PAS domain S-box protein [Deltaproteobacteria bacterium]